MKEDSLTIRTTIKNNLFKRTLFKGSFFSLLGFLPLIYGSLWMDTAILSVWGIPIFVMGMTCITYGMLPFKKLSALQKHPNELYLIDNQSLTFLQQGNKTLTIPLSSIASLSYFENSSVYGIQLKLKNSPEKKVVVHNPRFAYEKYEKKSRRKYSCDLFFPYFSKRSLEKIKP